LRSVVENSSENVTIVDPDGTLRYASPAFGRMLGYAPEEVVGKMNVLDHVHPDDLPHVLEETEKALSAGGVATNRAEYRFRHKDGSWLWVESAGTYLLDDPHVKGVVVQTRDITERKRTEKALREAEERFRRSFDDAAIGMALVGTDGRFLRTNRSLCEILGYREEELLEKSFQDITHPDDLDADLDQVRRMLVGEIRTYQMEKRYFHKEGQVVWVLLSVSMVHDEEGDPLYFVSQIQDISERKRAEQKIRDAEQRYRTLVEQIPAVTYIDPVDDPDTSLYTSPHIEQMLGYTPAEWQTEKLWPKRLHPDDRERVLAADKRFEAGAASRSGRSTACWPRTTR
jgi:PAS domain S-box-containing protein